MVYRNKRVGGDMEYKLKVKITDLKGYKSIQLSESKFKKLLRVLQCDFKPYEVIVGDIVTIIKIQCTEAIYEMLKGKLKENNMDNNFEILDNDDLKMVLEEIYNKEATVKNDNSVVIDNGDLRVYAKYSKATQYIYISATRTIDGITSLEYSTLLKEPTYKAVNDFCKLASTMRVGD